MLFTAKINIIFGISTSNYAGISKIYAEKQVALRSLTFTGRFVPNMLMKACIFSSWVYRPLDHISRASYCQALFL